MEWEYSNPENMERKVVFCILFGGSCKDYSGDSYSIWQYLKQEEGPGFCTSGTCNFPKFRFAGISKQSPFSRQKVQQLDVNLMTKIQKEYGFKCRSSPAQQIPTLPQNCRRASHTASVKASPVQSGVCWETIHTSIMCNLRSISPQFPNSSLPPDHWYSFGSLWMSNLSHMTWTFKWNGLISPSSRDRDRLQLITVKQTVLRSSCPQLTGEVKDIKWLEAEVLNRQYYSKMFIGSKAACQRVYDKTSNLASWQPYTLRIGDGILASKKLISSCLSSEGLQG